MTGGHSYTKDGTYKTRSLLVTALLLPVAREMSFVSLAFLHAIGLTFCDIYRVLQEIWPVSL